MLTHALQFLTLTTVAVVCLTPVAFFAVAVVAGVRAGRRERMIEDERKRKGVA